MSQELYPLDPEKFARLIEERAWVPIAAVVVVYLLRLVKSDTKLPINIPSGWPRFAVLFLLGFVSGVLEKVASAAPGMHYDPKTWTSAIVGGLLTSVIALTMHNAYESMSGGKELPLPKALLVPGARPSPDKPPSIPPEDLSEKEKEDLPS